MSPNLDFELDTAKLDFVDFIPLVRLYRFDFS